MTDCIIAGAGPAGLSAATYACRFGHSVKIVEPLAPGGQLMYIDKIENYPASGPVSGFTLADAMQSQAEGFGAEIIYDEVTAVKQEDGFFTLTCSGSELQAKSVIIATGARHRKLGIPGEDTFCNVHKVVRHIILADAVFLVDKFKVFVALGALRVHILFVFRKIRAEFYHHAKSVCAFGKYVNAVCPFDSDG